VSGHLKETRCEWVEELEALWDAWSLENIETLLTAVLYDHTGSTFDLESLQDLSHERGTRIC
jgi:vacuolar-type H+-ATPase subunit C/Vma6